MPGVTYQDFAIFVGVEGFILRDGVLDHEILRSIYQIEHRVVEMTEDFCEVIVLLKRESREPKFRVLIAWERYASESCWTACYTTVAECLIRILPWLFILWQYRTHAYNFRPLFSFSIHGLSYHRSLSICSNYEFMFDFFAVEEQLGARSCDFSLNNLYIFAELLNQLLLINSCDFAVILL